MTPQISLQLRSFSSEPALSWDPLFEQASAADDAGVDRVVVSDHVAFGERLEEYARPEVGGTSGGRQPTGPDGSWLDPLTTLSFLAARTRRVRVGTNILLAALRRPVVLAKTLATMDVLSHGRVDIGVGVGWQREEYEAAGLDFATRGATLDHTLAVCQTLWRENIASFDDDRLQFERIHQMPKPLQSGGIPIWVSGTVNAPVLRRLPRFGSGWIPWGDSAANVEQGIAKMREGVAALGRDPGDIGVVGNLVLPRTPAGALDADVVANRVRAMVTAGVTDVRAMLAVPSEYNETLDLLVPLVEAFHQAID